MGPCFMSTEDVVEAAHTAHNEHASMGPCFMSTEDAGDLTRAEWWQPASMGPCFMSTEDAELRQTVVPTAELQWGRAS